MSDHDEQHNTESIDDVVMELEEEIVEEEGLNAKMKKLRDQLKQVTAERDEYLTGWQKAKADYINLKNSEAEARINLRTHIQHDCVHDLFPTLDSFQMAMAGEAWEQVDPTWRTGVEYIYQQLEKVLESYGVTEIAEIGIPFDPAIHEPMETEIVDDPSQNEHVLAIIQKGYQAGDKVLRPAKVKVGKIES